MQDKPKFRAIYLLPILYVITVYLFPVLWYALNKGTADAEDSIKAAQLLPLLLPGTMGLVNLIAVIACRSSLDRETLLTCAVIIKYCLVPFFLAGGTCIALAWILTFTPVVIMIFVGPAIAAVFSVLGYITLLGSAPFSVAYCVRSHREGVHGKLLALAGGILQFFFVGDTVSLIVLSLKEKKCVKATVALAALLVLAFLCAVGGFIQLMEYEMIKM